MPLAWRWNPFADTWHADSPAMTRGDVGGPAPSYLIATGWDGVVQAWAPRRVEPIRCGTVDEAKARCERYEAEAQRRRPDSHTLAATAAASPQPPDAPAPAVASATPARGVPDHEPEGCLWAPGLS